MSVTPLNIPLWRQLQAAAGVLQAVREGRSATAAIEAVSGDLRPGVQALAWQALRQLGRAQALRRQLARREPPPMADALLCTALALAWDDAQAPYAPFTLVDQAVEAAKRDSAMQAQAAFINACLRRFLRERPALVAATQTDLEARWNHPRWWIERLRREHPQSWREILQASNAAPPLTLRVNARHASPQQAAQALAARGIETRPSGKHGLVMVKPRPVAQIPGFAEGLLSVQDVGAQMAAPLLLQALAPAVRAARKPRILDACAAPGGKTAHLLELCDADVTALDMDPARCERITQTLRRLGFQARVQAADACEPSQWWDGRAYDAILLDAPCTASGIVRRHPDVRWLRRESDLPQMALQQARLLAALWPLLAPGGVLLYCTCSVFRAEGQDAIEAFTTNNTDAVLLPGPGHLLPGGGPKPGTLPENHSGDHDGFYYALLRKSSGAAAA